MRGVAAWGGERTAGLPPPHLCMLMLKISLFCCVVVFLSPLFMHFPLVNCLLQFSMPQNNSQGTYFKNLQHFLRRKLLQIWTQERMRERDRERERERGSKLGSRPERRKGTRQKRSGAGPPLPRPQYSHSAKSTHTAQQLSLFRLLNQNTGCQSSELTQSRSYVM